MGMERNLAFTLIRGLKGRSANMLTWQGRVGNRLRDWFFTWKLDLGDTCENLL
jgi:hypothetical protein